MDWGGGIGNVWTGEEALCNVWTGEEALGNYLIQISRDQFYQKVGNGY